MTRAVTVNKRHYNWPTAPVVGVCIDGSQPAIDGESGYIEEAIKAGVAPYFKRLMQNGTSRIAHSVIPSFTNPNNLSIVTGSPPEVHGICGNYFFDQKSGEEVLMNDPEFMRADTILKAFHNQGARVCAITAKDKLRLLLGRGLEFDTGTAICFSAEKADQTSLHEHGIEEVLELVGLSVPEVYSAALSEFVFAAGVAIMKRDRPDIMYLSTTDYLQHKCEPGSDEANAFYAMMDRYLGQLDAMGCLLVITADHGMNRKHGADGQPDVIYLQSLLDDWIGPGAARVILPITDPYVGHHGALGSFATIYLADGAKLETVADRLSSLDGIASVLDRSSACERFQLPADRVGDIVVISEKTKVLGTIPERHDLTQLNGPLRSHGGLTEQNVPLLVNRQIDLGGDQQLRNYDIYDVALNHAMAAV